MNLSLPGGGFFGGAPSMPAQTPPPPPPPPVQRKTQADVEAAELAKKKKTIAAQANTGRGATILSDIGNDEKLGAL